MRFALCFLPSLFLAAACAGNVEPSSTNTREPAAPPSKSPETNRGSPPAQSTESTWCTTAGQHDFCSDFDGENPFANWTDVLRGNDRKQKDVDELFASDRSSPNALRISGGDITTEGRSDSSFYVWSGTFLSKKLPATTSTTATLSFDLYVAKAKWHTGVVELRGRTAADGIAFGLDLSIGEEATWLSAAVGTIPKLPPIARDQWVRVEITIDDNGGQGGVAQLAFDGVNAGSATFEGSLASSAETTLYLGVSRSAPSEAYDVRYDNVIVDLK
jgi:hypothetical protein